jgi:hypothetical protein
VFTRRDYIVGMVRSRHHEMGIGLAKMLREAGLPLREDKLSPTCLSLKPVIDIEVHLQ